MRASLHTPTPLLLLLFLSLVFACSKKSETIPEPSPTAAAAASGEQSPGMHVVVGAHGFEPVSLAVPKGAPGSTVPVTFVRMTDETCAKEVVFPDVGIKKELPLKTPVTVDVPADTARTLTFQCGMAMYKGALVVK
jgi:plastocyanin domain-containing protein